MKVHEHSSTSVINREALELHTKRNLKLQLVNSTFTEAHCTKNGVSFKIKPKFTWGLKYTLSLLLNKYHVYLLK